MNIFQIGAIGLLVILHPAQVAQAEDRDRPMNILIAISDDQSFPHISALGSTFVNTPNIDQIASEGFVFLNAYAGSPGCAPSRAALLTGQHHWMIGAAGTHDSSFPAHYDTFVDILDRAGYKVGYTGKGWGPGSWEMGGRTRNPAGTEYNKLKMSDDRLAATSPIDYSANFDLFMQERKKGEPFYFWFGAHEPHLAYANAEHTPENLAKVKVPDFLPDTQTSRSVLMDYANEISYFDNHLGKIIARLKAEGELDNTLILITSDNGMPMPRSKANGYDYGIHVPLVARWPGGTRRRVSVSTPIGFTDLSATILGAAALPIPRQFVGESLVPLLSGKTRQLAPNRAVYAGRERHTSARYNNFGYPQRIMRKGDMLLIWNAKPGRFPAGDPQAFIQGELKDAYNDIDGSLLKRELLTRRSDPKIAPFLHLAVDKRPEWEMFDLSRDPYNLRSVVEDPAYSSQFAQLKQELMATLRKTGDPRVTGNDHLWEDFPRVGGPIRQFPPQPND